MTMHTIILLFLAHSIQLSWGADWCYQSQVTCNATCRGPGDWPLVSQLCGGGAQSPVNIVSNSTRADCSMSPLELVGYEETFHGRIVNNGHTVQLDIPSSARVQLAVPYKALQLHFHWGKDGGPGSEHTIDGQRFAMEMHIVHIKEQYDTLAEALADGAGVAVLGFFFQEHATPNQHYDPIIAALKDLRHAWSNSTLRGVSLAQLMPSEVSLGPYFRYQGSLTTPLCHEAVTWTLFKTPILLSRKQLSAFSGLRSAGGHSMVNTYRPLQPLNKRTVFYYSGASLPLVSTALLVCSVLISRAPSLNSEG